MTASPTLISLFVLGSILVAGRTEAASATAQSVTMTMADKSDSSVASASTVAKLKAMRARFVEGKFEACLQEATKAKAAAKALEPWILDLELDCAEKLPSSKASAERIEKVLKQADQKMAWMTFGPWAVSLRKVWGRLHLIAIEMNMKIDRDRSWRHVESLSLAAGTALDETGRAKLWRMAGEILFLQQKTDAARDFFRRSLNEQEQSDLRERLRSLETTTTGDFGPMAPTVSAPTKVSEGSQAEGELYERVNNAIKSGDMVGAAEDGIKFLQDYPGSSKAKWIADRLIENLVSVGEKSLGTTGEKFVPVRDALLKSMVKVDGERGAEWGRTLFNKGLWTESAKIAAAAAGNHVGSRSTKTLEMALEASYAIDDFKSVRSFGDELVEKHSGTSSSRLALLRMALLAYRQGDDLRTVSLLEKLLSAPQGETLELQARYWMWRSLDRSKSERAPAMAEELARKFPFSYYGLRARIETAGGKLEWPKETPKLESKVWMTSEEKLAWERAGILIVSGWFEEAQEELRVLPPPTTPEAKAVRARVLGLAKNYLQASKMANDAWDAKFDLRRVDLMRVAWPEEHKALFESAAKAKGLDPVLTRSLTKQESGYNPKAVSSSNALGLMQMIPPTAREIADDLKLGKLNLPDDMFEPSRNIPMGTHYVAKMLNQFKGHVPLALAAYNAGPTRVDRWLKARPSLQGLETVRSSASEFEVWIDEFPYNETSFYVKAILRNVLLYRLLDDGSLGPVSPQEPLWQSRAGTTRP